MTVSRLRDIPGIGVDRMGDAADALGDPRTLRLENLDTDLRPPTAALAASRLAIDDDRANSYLPFQGHSRLREVATRHVARTAGDRYDWRRDCVITAGGLNGITNVLLATLELGDEVVLAEPAYAGLVNRVHLAGGVPRYARMEPTPTGWRLSTDAIDAAISPRTRVLLMMSPSMPTGAVITTEVWQHIAEIAVERDLWIVVDAAMERIRFDGGTAFSPASLGDDVAARVITVGSASKELRMIGWRVGWIVGPRSIMGDIHTVGLTNVVCQVGIAQEAVAAALDAPDADADIAAANAELGARAEFMVDQLRGLPVIPPAGGWSMLLDCRPLGCEPAELSERLLREAAIAATPMNGWGPSGARYLRFVFANEPVARLGDFGDRVRQVLERNS